jgi:hypothetical protein
VSAAEGTPWERRAAVGFWTGWGQTLQQALFDPEKLFASARLDRGGAQLGFALFTTSVFWAFGQILEGLLVRGPLGATLLQRLLPATARNPNVAPMVQKMLALQERVAGPGMVIAFAAATPVAAFVLLYLNAAVTHAVAALLRQARRGFAATFAACAYGCAPLVLLAIPECGSIVGVIWLVVLTGIGMKVTHGISAGGAAATVLVPYFVLCCTTFAAMASLLVALHGLMGSP